MSAIAKFVRKRRPRIKDPEIRAMRDCWDLIAPFDRETRGRMLWWLREYSQDRKRDTPQATP